MPHAVAAGPAPKATRAPSLTGTVKVGRTLTLNRGTWTPAPTSYAYQWYANGPPPRGRHAPAGSTASGRGRLMTRAIRAAAAHSAPEAYQTTS
ncbi:hypothetical protein EF906_23960 [Streptomyces sp. WAC08241]|nr:hypothetical protein EF906_23960 [Streptomyces sp. WAC08241]